MTQELAGILQLVSIDRDAVPRRRQRSNGESYGFFDSNANIPFWTKQHLD